jgi:hypothetical protein
MKLVTFSSDGSADHVGAPVNDDHDVIDVSAAEPTPAAHHANEKRK